MNEHEAWLAQRRTGITGTDVGKIMGLSHWGTQYDVWLDKMGKGKFVEENEKMSWGKRLEPVCLDYYAEKHNVSIEKPSLMRGKEDWIIANPDGFVYDSKDADRKPLWGVEIKTSRVPPKTTQWSDPSSGEPIRAPKDYITQCVWYMMATDLPRWDLCVLLGGSEWREYTLLREQYKHTEEAIYEKCKSFWFDYCVNRVEPR